MGYFEPPGGPKYPTSFATVTARVTASSADGIWASAPPAPLACPAAGAESNAVFGKTVQVWPLSSERKTPP